MATKPAEKHYTATAYIINGEAEKRILMVYHRKYDNWMPPGGHIERHENPLEAVVREVNEETGINLSEVPVKKLSDEVILLRQPDFLIQAPIAAYGDEPAHYHIDFGYVFHIDPRVKLNPASSESQQIEWFTARELSDLNTFTNVRLLALNLLNNDAKEIN